MDALPWCELSLAALWCPVSPLEVGGDSVLGHHDRIEDEPPSQAVVGAALAVFLDELRFEKKERREKEEKDQRRLSWRVKPADAGGSGPTRHPPPATRHRSVTVATAAAWGCGAAGPGRAAVTVTARFRPGAGSCVLGPQPGSVAKPRQ